MTQLLDEVRAEVERLHDFIAGWFQGTVAQADAEADFEYQFTARLHPEFENVQPSGRVLSRENLLNALSGARGSNPDFRIEVRDTRILGHWPDCGLILAGYLVPGLLEQLIKKAAHTLHMVRTRLHFLHPMPRP